MISLIVAMAKNNVIGANNQLPWHLPSDLQRFKHITNGHHIIMGRKTFESIGRLLPNRHSIIITRQQDYRVFGASVVSSLKEALQIAQQTDKEPFVIGGAALFELALPLADRIYMTRIHQDFEGDTFFPALAAGEWQESERQDHAPDATNLYFYSFSTLQRLSKTPKPLP